MVWRYVNNGGYNVKSAYNLIMEKFVDQASLCKEGDWSLIRKIDIPPRVKLFLWRLCYDCLPTKTKLRTRGVECSLMCALCENQIENVFHAFCHLSKE
ncbi:hypothetical protein JHK82_042321 [Glycine max]|uniref:Reverse transcriptase zinc-binding domain-containing protein n=1 Tax=Glycine soja TaxID=3848 RepID=A0A0B2Q3R8_GLYSO|nr:hypothetical protein JHK87_042278 [Glycine soja]KAG4949126.1 hypothetical protein JHK86_042365 [Glycine max]KAG4956609.1 hypothetical protein JHK85_042989 [Glycine max]KAG5105351.1 hypothetical protein JHK82_042321 [Glycine max]KAG5116477.1 hypothetical protein JHK84_042590 [Glycine max]